MNSKGAINSDTMNDAIVLYVAVSVCLVLVLYTLKKRIAGAPVHLLLFGCYNALLHYAIYKYSGCGAGFLWWFCLLLLTLLHIVVLAVILICFRYREKM